MFNRKANVLKLNNYRTYTVFGVITLSIMEYISNVMSSESMQLTGNDTLLSILPHFVCLAGP